MSGVTKKHQQLQIANDTERIFIIDRNCESQIAGFSDRKNLDHYPVDMGLSNDVSQNLNGLYVLFFPSRMAIGVHLHGTI